MEMNVYDNECNIQYESNGIKWYQVEVHYHNEIFVQYRVWRDIEKFATIYITHDYVPYQARTDKELWLDHVKNFIIQEFIALEEGRYKSRVITAMGILECIGKDKEVP